MGITHDELLAKIDNLTCCSGAHEVALRAVVELHKVLLVKNYENDTDWYECQACGGTDYPCETIKAIEKELE